MEFHRWVAQIDRLLGDYRAVTYKRGEVLGFIANTHLDGVRVYDVRHCSAGPFDEEANRSTELAIDRHLQAAEPLLQFPALEEQAQELRRRLRDVGIQWEPEVIIVGRKP